MRCRKLSNQGLLWICLSPLYIWCKELAPLSHPIRCKPKANHDLDTRVFPRFGQFAWFYFEFSNLLIDCCDNFGFRFTTLNRKTLYEPVIIYCYKLISSNGNNLKLIIFSEKIFAHSKTGYLTHSPISNKKKSICYFRVA